MSDKQALKRIAANLRRYRGERTYTDVASMANTYPASVRRIEEAEHMPGAGLLTRLAEALDVSVADLLKPTGKTFAKSA